MKKSGLIVCVLCVSCQSVQPTDECNSKVTTVRIEDGRSYGEIFASALIEGFVHGFLNAAFNRH